MLRFVLAALAASSLAGHAVAQPLTTAEAEQITGLLDGLLDGLQTQDAPGVAVGVVRGGERVFEHHLGLADLSHRVPIGPETRFNIASNAKQFVALMVLELAEEGKLDLDADFRVHLDGALPLIGETITVRQLILHTSGVRDVYDLIALTGENWYERALTSADAVALLNRQRGLNFEPGSDTLYSNSNYVLLAEVIAAVTGEDFATYAAAFFARLGMDETGWKRRYGDVVPHQARAYNDWGGWFENPSVANLFGDGFLFSTLDDQLAFEALLQQAAPGEKERGGPAGFSRAVLERSQTRPDASERETAQQNAYGYGLEHDTFRGLDRVWHIGSTGGFNAYSVRYPSESLSVVVLGNNGTIGVVNLGNQIAAALLEGAFTPGPAYPAGPERVLDRPDDAAVLGRYEQAGGSIIEITRRDGALHRELPGRDPVRLVHERGNVFAYDTIPDLKIAFEPDRFRLFLPTQPVAEFTRLAPVPQTPAALASLEGRYMNDETGVSITVEHAGGASYRVTRTGPGGGGAEERRFSTDAQLVAAGDLRAGGYRLRFERGANGADGADGTITALLLDGGRIRRVRFERRD